MWETRLKHTNLVQVWDLDLGLFNTYRWKKETKKPEKFNENKNEIGSYNVSEFVFMYTLLGEFFTDDLIFVGI